MPQGIRFQFLPRPTNDHPNTGHSEAKDHDPKANRGRRRFQQGRGKADSGNDGHVLTMHDRLARVVRRIENI
jgi:hypothetical protein